MFIFHQIKMIRKKLKNPRDLTSGVSLIMMLNSLKRLPKDWPFVTWIGIESEPKIYSWLFLHFVLQEDVCWRCLFTHQNLAKKELLRKRHWDQKNLEDQKTMLLLMKGVVQFHGFYFLKSLRLDTLIIPVIILKIGSLHDLSLTERQIMKKAVWPSHWLLRCLIEP